MGNPIQLVIPSAESGNLVVAAHGQPAWLRIEFGQITRPQTLEPNRSARAGPNGCRARGEGAADTTPSPRARARGQSPPQIAQALRVSSSTIHRHLDKQHVSSQAIRVRRTSEHPYTQRRHNPEPTCRSTHHRLLGQRRRNNQGDVAGGGQQRIDPLHGDRQLITGAGEVRSRPGTPEATASRHLDGLCAGQWSGLLGGVVWFGSVDDAVDRGAADAVFLGEIGQGHLAFGVAAPDGARGRGRQLGLFAA